MKHNYFFGVVLAFLLLFSVASVAQNTVQLSGICILEDVTLNENGTLDGKVWYTGSGTVLGFSGVSIDLYWDASFDRWFLAFDGQPYFENSSDTDLPPATTAGGWIETVDNIECEEDPETPLVVEGEGTQGPTDTDGDGTPDSTDGCPLDSTKIAPGVCGCGVPDTDSDGDGTPNCNDACPNDANKTAPGACGCGVPDTDSDSDGTPDCNDACPADSTKTTPGACGCGVPDTDSDGDGTPNCNDACPNDANKTAPGACGCGVSDADSDGDGTPNCNDACPNDANKTAPGACGCGVPDTDSDGNGTPDCNDACATSQPITLPFSKDGVGEFCWVTDGNINFINSWNLQLLEVNGVSFTNAWSTNMPPRINGKYYFHYISQYPWGHFEVQGTSPSPNNTCSNPVSINIPFSKDGVGEFCWETTGNITHVNSWNLISLTINGVSYTNQWSSSLPAKINGKYYISYKSQLPWGHFEAGGSNFNAPEAANLYSAATRTHTAKLYPNPTNGEAWLDLNNYTGVDCLIQVTDVRGALLRKISTNESGSHMIQLDMSGLSSGLYFVQIKPQSAPVQVIKLMVESK